MVQRTCWCLLCFGWPTKLCVVLDGNGLSIDLHAFSIVFSWQMITNVVHVSHDHQLLQRFSCELLLFVFCTGEGHVLAGLFSGSYCSSL